MIKVVESRPRMRWRPGAFKARAERARAARRHYAPDTAEPLFNVLVVNNATLRVEARRGVPCGLPRQRALNVARVVEHEIDPNLQHVLVIDFARTT